MTWEEYFELCKERLEQTDMSSRESIHDYNEWRRALRKQVCEDELKMASVRPGDSLSR